VNLEPTATRDPITSSRLWNGGSRNAVRSTRSATLCPAWENASREQRERGAGQAARLWQQRAQPANIDEDSQVKRHLKL